MAYIFSREADEFARKNSKEKAKKVHRNKEEEEEEEKEEKPPLKKKHKCRICDKEHPRFACKYKCKLCDKKGHMSEGCWVKFPEMALGCRRALLLRRTIRRRTPQPQEVQKEMFQITRWF